MSFTDAVAGLRIQLAVDERLSLPAAVRSMSLMMGLPLDTEENTDVTLPDQVEALCEILGFSVPLGNAEVVHSASDVDDLEDEDVGSQMASMPSAASTSSSKEGKEKKQRETSVIWFLLLSSCRTDSYTLCLLCRHHGIVLRGRYQEVVRERQTRIMETHARATKEC